MSLALIPIAALFFLIFSSSPSDKTPPNSHTNSVVLKQKKEDAEEKKEAIKQRLFLESRQTELDRIEAATRDPLANHPPDENLDEKSEYETILSYISTKYKKVSDDDAHEIANSLVVYGKEHDMDPKLACAVIARESAFNKTAVSSTGAKGLGQIKDFNFSTLNINNPYDIKQNVSGTTEYLKKLLTKWDKKMKSSLTPSTSNAQPSVVVSGEVPQSDSDKIKLTLASYFKGYTNVNKKGVDPKTEEYVKDIIKNYNDLQAIKSEKRFKKQE